VTVQFQVSGRTHPGRVRRTNDDAWSSYVPTDPYALSTKGAFFAVADGLNGHQNGGVASRRAIETTLYTYYRDPSPDPANSLARAVEMANFDLHSLSHSFPAYASLRTTLVAAVVRASEAVVANVGDSRAYLVRGPYLWQITRDHSWVAEFAAGVLSPAEVRRHPWGRVITRALGLAKDVQVDLFRVTLQSGDTLMLCSDGLTDLVNEHDIGQVVRQTPPAWAAGTLVDRANRLGGSDNITAVVARVWPAVPYPLAYPAYGWPGYRPPPPAYRPAAATAASEPAWVPLVELTGGMAGAAGVIALIMALASL
jgi:serine/threonine protein phosphatase PrpC